MLDRPSIQDIAEVLALASPETPWWYEGPVRHRVRVILLETRWTRSWHRADLEARRLVANGRLKNGVRMPAGWDSDTDLSSWIGSLECAICGKIVIQKIHNQVYCSSRCKTRANYIGATKQRLQRCEKCGEIFEGGTVEAKYCSAACSYAARQPRKLFQARVRYAARRGVDLCDRSCKICDGPMPEDAHLSAQFCSGACRHENRLRYRRAAYRQRQLNGNGHADPGGHDGDRDDRPPARAGAPGGAALAAAAAAAGG
jgi:hypothetical protein